MKCPKEIDYVVIIIFRTRALIFALKLALLISTSFQFLFPFMHFYSIPSTVKTYSTPYEPNDTIGVKNDK